MAAAANVARRRPSDLLAEARAVASSRLPWLPGIHRPTRRERLRRRAILQHDAGRGMPRARGMLVADKQPTAGDVAIAGRLLRAFQAADASTTALAQGREDVWTLIAADQGSFTSLLRNGTEEQLAAYLCNVSRHDASIGIVQGNAEYERLVRDPGYRAFLTLMAKDKLASLAEAVGSLPVENPEQGAYGQSLHVPPEELVAGISHRLGVDIAPPDIDGGLFKLVTTRGLFGERDVNAIFTAWLLKRISMQRGTKRICEIGAGSGRVAYWSHRLGLKSRVLVDLPHVNVVQGYYLLKSLPAECVRLFGEEETDATEVTIWPNSAIDAVPQPAFDLVLNQDSMPEMSRATVDEYLEWIRLRCCGAFVSINHESKPPYGRGLAHVSVPEAAAAIGGLVLEDRYPYWLRKGYVVEIYAVAEPAAS